MLKKYLYYLMTDTNFKFWKSNFLYIMRLVKWLVRKYN